MLVINAHATAEGVLLKTEVGEGEEKVFLTGRHLGQLIFEYTPRARFKNLMVAGYKHKSKLEKKIQHKIKVTQNDSLQYSYIATSRVTNIAINKARKCNLQN